MSIKDVLLALSCCQLANCEECPLYRMHGSGCKKYLMFLAEDIIVDLQKELKDWEFIYGRN